MTQRNCIPIKIFSFLNGDLEGLFCRALVDWRPVEYFRARRPALYEHSAALLDRHFWSQLSIENYDMIVFAMSSEDLGELIGAWADRGSSVPIWSRLPMATVVVLKDAARNDWEQAGRLEFDGILTAPLETKITADKLQASLEKAGRRRNLIERYNRVRRLCRQANRKRRQLRDKVDLLCRDLIKSNIQFTATLQDVQRAYEFQNSLFGEFDRRYMLYKALRGLKAPLGDCSIAMYLGEQKQFEAHVTGAWRCDEDDITEIEELFIKTVVRQVLKTGHNVSISDVETWPTISDTQRSILRDWSLLGLPIIYEGDILGIVVIYRPAHKKFGKNDEDKIQPMLGPLGQALASLQKLEHVILSG